MYLLSETNGTLIPGFPDKLSRSAQEATARLMGALHYSRPPVVLKNFTKKYQEIPTRSCYRGVFEEEFWSNFSKREINLAPESWINSERLREVATACGYNDEPKIRRLCQTLELGANLGCRGKARLQTVEKNSPTAYEYGDRLTDSLQSWLAEDLAAGPLTREEVEQTFDWKLVTVNPMAVRLKPNGKARIIVDMSAPHIRDREILEDAVTPTSINSGIRKEEFPASMAGTKDVLALLYCVGREGEMCKADWNSAYKHIHVRAEDLPLQFLQWGGRYFMERALVFGCTSSPGIYNEIAATVVSLAILKAEVSQRNVLQCLDDVVNISTRRSGECLEFYKAYREVCEMIGVSLASEDDPGKAFSPCTRGIVLGIEYDIPSFSWRLPRDKVSYMMRTLFDIVEGKEITVEDALSLAGRLNHYYLLVPGGKWERGWIQEMASNNAPKTQRICPSDIARSQAQWWILNMATAAEWTPIPDIRNITPSDVLMIFPDAAGGSDTDIKLGLGGCVWTEGRIPWVYLPWSYMIRSNMKDEEGNKFARKLSMLEAAAALATVCSHPDLIRNTNIRVASDNIGFVNAMRKGNSRCKFTLTIMMALYHVTMALNTGIEVVKTPRVSGPGERIADHLSKGKMKEAFREAASFQAEPSYIPRTLVRWLEHPQETRLLGQAIVKEMSGYTEVLQWNVEMVDDVEALVQHGSKKRKLSE